MARTIVQSTGNAGDLSDSFVRAAKLLIDGGLKLCAGTKLVSRYAVIVVDPAGSVCNRVLAVGQRICRA